MSNQMPARGLSAHFGDFCFCFPHAILAKVGYSGRDRLLYGFGRMRLADRDERDVVRPAISAERGLCYLFMDVFQTLAEFCLLRF